MNYNIWNKWDKLQTVMLGECYYPEFFRDIKSTKVRSALQRISEQTQEDLEGFKQVLNDFGCTVIRPDIDTNDSLMNYVNSDGKVKFIPRSPLQPRDCQLVIGNDLLYTNVDHPGIKSALTRYNSTYTQITSPLTAISYNGHKGNDAPDWPTYEDYLQRFIAHKPFSDEEHVHNEILDIVEKENSFGFAINAPSITVVGTDIYVDLHKSETEELFDYYLRKFKEIFWDFKINYLTIGGHNDACFHTIKPGAILSLHEIQRYENTFPEWDVCYLPDQSWSQVDKFMQLKQQTGGKWWVPGEEDNTEFTNFVETWLQDWVGYVEETVFDVNVLMLDEHHCCVSNPNNEQVNAFLKKHKVEPVYVPWRHRYFWDGGLHCITLDLYRDGGPVDYFPNRQKPVTDKGFVNA